MRIEVKDLRYSYGEAKVLSNIALDGVSLTVEEGDFFGIIGQTGSGKTTFVQHLNGLIKLGKDCGSIKVGGYDLGRFARRSVWSFNIPNINFLPKLFLTTWRSV